MRKRQWKVKIKLLFLSPLVIIHIVYSYMYLA